MEDKPPLMPPAYLLESALPSVDHAAGNRAAWPFFVFLDMGQLFRFVSRLFKPRNGSLGRVSGRLCAPAMVGRLVGGL